MSARAQIESWLAMADLPPALPRKLDAEGFWSASMGGVTLTLGIPAHLEQAERPQFFLYMPLLSLEGFVSTVRERFYRRLFEIQLRGELPPGMAFGMDSDGDILALAGRYPVRVMEAALFSETIRLVLSAGTELRPQLEACLTALAEESGAGSTSPGGIAPSAAPSAAMPAASSACLSDQDILRMQAFQNIQI